MLALIWIKDPKDGVTLTALTVWTALCVCDGHYMLHRLQ